jgi:hypothetical protein
MNVRAPASAVRCLKVDRLRQVWLTQRDGESPRVLKTWPLKVWRLLRFMPEISPFVRRVLLRALRSQAWVQSLQTRRNSWERSPVPLSLHPARNAAAGSDLAGAQFLQ